MNDCFKMDGDTHHFGSTLIDWFFKYECLHSWMTCWCVGFYLSNTNVVFGSCVYFLIDRPSNYANGCCLCNRFLRRFIIKWKLNILIGWNGKYWCICLCECVHCAFAYLAILDWMDQLTIKSIQLFLCPQVIDAFYQPNNVATIGIDIEAV